MSRPIMRYSSNLDCRVYLQRGNHWTTKSDLSRNLWVPFLIEEFLWASFLIEEYLWVSFLIEEFAELYTRKFKSFSSILIKW